MTKRAAVYARYSSEEQTGGESIEYQLEQSKDHITKQGWSLGEVFVDRAKSGTTTYRREEFNRMVALAKAKDRPFDIVVAWSTSRFGRNMDKCAVNKAFLRKQGVEVHFVSQPMPDGHVGKLIEKIFEWTDELQSIQIGENAFQGQKQVTQSGKAPHGYRRVRVPDPEGKRDKNGKVVEYVTYEVVEEQAEVVRRVFTMYAEGASYKKVAHTLNEEGVTSPGGSTWAPSAVRAILLNENYRGSRVWNQTRRNKKLQRGTKVPKKREDWVISEGAHDVIVDGDLWARVEARMDRIRSDGNGKGGNNTAHSPFLLTGLLKCGQCGANFVMSTRRKSGKIYRYYKCSYHHNRGDAVCANRRMVPQGVVESGVLDILSDQLFTPETVDAVLKEYRQTEAGGWTELETIRRLEKRIQAIAREAQNLTAAIKMGGSIPELVGELNACREQRAVLEREFVTANAKVAPQIDDEITAEHVEEALRDLQTTLKYADPEERKQVVQENVKEVRIPPEGDAELVSAPDGFARLFGVHSNGDPDRVWTPFSSAQDSYCVLRSKRPGTPLLGCRCRRRSTGASGKGTLP